MTGFAYVFFSAFCYAAISILIKYAYSIGITPLILLSETATISCLILWAGLLLFKRDFLRIDWGQGKRILIQGVFGNLLMSLSFFFAIKYLNASIATLILFTHPALVMVLTAVFYKERFRWGHYVSLVAILGGSLCVLDVFSVAAGKITPLGVLLGIIASCGLGFSNFYGQKTLDTTHPFTVLTYLMTIQAVVFNLINPPVHLFTGILNMQVWGIILIIAIFNGIFPTLFILKGISLIGASKASLLSTVELPLTIIMAFIFLGETMNWVQVLGGILIMTGIFILPKERSSGVAVKCPES